jgi:hypothetical protein
MTDFNAYNTFQLVNSIEKRKPTTVASVKLANPTTDATAKELLIRQFNAYNGKGTAELQVRLDFVKETYMVAVAA